MTAIHLLLRMLDRATSALATILYGAPAWVDDLPENNHSECRLLMALGADVLQLRSTQEGLAALAQGPWDLVLSDMARDGIADAGLQMLRHLPRGSPPVVYYVGRANKSRPVPRGAFGIADRPQPLLHLVFRQLVAIIKHSPQT